MPSLPIITCWVDRRCSFASWRRRVEQHPVELDTRGAHALAAIEQRRVGHERLDHEIALRAPGASATRRKHATCASCSSSPKNVLNTT